jgi:hypothetical protein
MLLKCQKAAVRIKLRDRNPDLFTAFEILDHTRIALNQVHKLESSAPRVVWISHAHSPANALTHTSRITGNPSVIR